MKIIEMILIAIGLAMDAFAVALCKGLAMKKVSFLKALKIGIWFGTFQAIMPVLGFYLGNTFSELMHIASHWIAFLLLTWIGWNMIQESKQEKVEWENEDSRFQTMLPLAIATSIDALAIGVTFSFLNVKIVWAAFWIGTITLEISTIGVKIGNLFGKRFEKQAQTIGGILLIGLGIKNLLEHLF